MKHPKLHLSKVLFMYLFMYWHPFKIIVLVTVQCKVVNTGVCRTMVDLL